MGLSARAVTTAASIPKQRRSPRATLYSPPPSQTWKLRAVCTRPSPGSRRSITSPKLNRSHRQSFLDLIVRLICLESEKLQFVANHILTRSEQTQRHSTK